MAAALDQADEQGGQPTFPLLGLQLGVWHGCYAGVEAPWLRWYEADGRLLPTAAELAESARVRAEQAEAKATAETEARAKAEARAEELARRLAELTGKPGS